MTPHTTHRRRRTALAAATAALAVSLTGCSTSLIDFPEDHEPTPIPDTGNRQTVAVAHEALPTIPVKGRAPKTGYDRDEFGQRWADIDRDGCDQRNQVLARDLTDVTYASPTSCRVTSGTLHDPFTGAAIDFRRGEGTSNDVQIDHTVSLSNSWQTGAQQLTAQQREELANDPDNLRAVDGPTNAAKGDADAATWLPPNRAHWCDYAASQTLVKAEYELWMTPAEHDRIETILNDC